MSKITFWAILFLPWLQSYRQWSVWFELSLGDIHITLHMLLLSQSILLIFIDLLKYTTNLSCLITIAYLMQIERAYCWSTLYASSFPILAFILANSLVILYLVCRLIFLYCCLYCPNCSNSLFYCFHSSSARITITVKTNDILNFLHLFLKWTSVLSMKQQFHFNVSLTSCTYLPSMCSPDAPFRLQNWKRQFSVNFSSDQSPDIITITREVFSSLPVAEHVDGGAKGKTVHAADVVAIKINLLLCPGQSTSLL